MDHGPAHDQADLRHRRRRPRRRQGGRGAPRPRLRRARAAHRRRARAALRTPTADQGLPARRVRAREDPRPRRGLLRRPRPRAADRHDRDRGGSRGVEGHARRRPRAGLRPPAARHGRGAAAPHHPGADLDGVHALRTLADCDALRERLVPGGRAVVVGAGWIGSEVAASARQLGLDVTVIDPARLPNERIFGAEVGAFYRDVHARTGSTWRSARASRPSRATAPSPVCGPRGRLIACDFVVVGIGVTPRVGLAREAGLAVDNGILVGERPADLRSGRLRRRRRRQRLAPVLRRAPPRRALGQRAQPGPGRRARMLGEPTATTTSPTSSPTSTTSGWSTPATRRDWDGSSSAATRRAREFIAFWLRAGASRPA